MASNSAGAILQALGINVNSEISEQFSRYSSASTDINNIKDAAAREHRDLTDTEKEEIKQKEEIIKQFKELGGVLGALPPEFNMLVSAVDNVVDTIKLMNEYGQEQVETLNRMNKSLAAIGETADGAVSVGNLQYRADKNWEDINRAFKAMFEPITALLTVGNLTLSEILVNVVGVNNSRNPNNISNGQFGWYTDRMAGNGLTVTDMTSDLSSFAAGFMNQGMSMSSASNLAVMLHNAVVKSKTYNDLSDEASKNEMMQAAFNAALSGGAFSEYGINTSGNVLTGYLAGEGIDNINVKLSESMESLYRVRLIHNQLGADSKESMQRQIKDWEKLGMEIDSSKGKLLSFDKELVLGAVDSTIPEMLMPEVVDNEGNVFGGTGELIDDTSDKVDALIERVREYLETLGLTPEEIDTFINLISSDAYSDLVAYAAQCGLTPEQIVTMIRTYNETPEALPELLRQWGLNEAEIQNFMGLLGELPKVTEDATDGALDGVVKYRDESIKNFQDIVDAIIEVINWLGRLNGFNTNNSLWGNIKALTGVSFYKDLGAAFGASMVGDYGYEAQTGLGGWVYDTFSANHDKWDSSFGNNTSISKGNTYNISVDGTYIVDSEEGMNRLGYGLRDVIAGIDQRDGGLR